MNQAVIDLADATMVPLNAQRAARALLALAQDTSEAARFSKIEDLVSDGWTGTVGQRTFITALENDWGAFSGWAVKKLKDPTTPPHTVDGVTVSSLATAQQYLAVVLVSS
ncbi:ribosome-inactivating family protein [Kitasatospora purpeofusca]|uniref:ribosome-inactivating family protein n=1 Tax=Kitasatospora purpeofusca TaxID=67352 RepID=UPI002A59E61A|nr:ribosome-inactivating family protein [Kitasatospora purpeofusca]MDY0810787.1 ribosome-inactivating family protein [Kitasatospora purpeofusca]